MASQTDSVPPTPGSYLASPFVPFSGSSQDEGEERIFAHMVQKALESCGRTRKWSVEDRAVGFFARGYSS